MICSTVILRWNTVPLSNLFTLLSPPAQVFLHILPDYESVGMHKPAMIDSSLNLIFGEEEYVGHHLKISLLLKMNSQHVPAHL